MRARGQTLVEKIVQRHTHALPRGTRVYTGDYVSIVPRHIMTHDNTSAVLKKFQGFFPNKALACVANKRQVVFTLDHDIQNKTPENLKKYKTIEDFAKQQGVDFYPAGRGIGHQVMCEEGYAWPQALVVASDSHSNMYGGLGCLGSPVVRTDAAAIWATGRTWWQVPPVTKVNLTGKLPTGATGKDVIIALCGVFNKDEVLNDCLEFAGDGVSTLDIDNRLTIANMTTEWGSLAGVFPVDAVTLKWLKERASVLENRGRSGVPSDADWPNQGSRASPRLNTKSVAALAADLLHADKDANYAKELHLDLSTVQPLVAGPNGVKTMTSVAELAAKKVKINKAYIVSCVNSRVSDIKAAAKVLKGKKIAPGVELYVSAASSEVEAESTRSGDWQDLTEAGAKVLPPGCGPCIGLGAGLLQAGEVGISATNRNFKGRMGSPDAIAYLASPAVVAASAAAGFITSPEPLKALGKPVGRLVTNPTSTATARSGAQVIAPGFPTEISGKIVFCPQDNMNTDGIYPGKYTYQERSSEEQAQVVMENYDPDFGRKVSAGMIMVGGSNFGTGSSREQAATALKFKGIRLLLAASFSETYKRNALNNGFLCVEVPDLVERLHKQLGNSAKTSLTEWPVTVNFVDCTVKAPELDKTYSFSPVGAAAQELIVAGGLEPWVVTQVQAKAATA